MHTLNFHGYKVGALFIGTLCVCSNTLSSSVLFITYCLSTSVGGMYVLGQNLGQSFADLGMCRFWAVVCMQTYEFYMVRVLVALQVQLEAPLTLRPNKMYSYEPRVSAYLAQGL